MNVEKRFISKILLEREIVKVLDAKIRSDFFEDTQYGAVFDWIVQYYQEHGNTPTASVLARNYPWFEVVKAPEDLTWYISEVKKAREYAILHDAAVEIAAAMKAGDSEQARVTMQQCVSSLDHDLSPMRDINMSDPAYIEQWWEEYEELEKHDGALRGIPTGFPTIDRATSGLRPGQLITFIGEPKAGKSTGLMLMYKAAHDHGHIPLLIGFEMSNEEQRNRYAAIRARVNFHRLDNATLRPNEKKLFMRSLRELESTPDLWLSADASATSTVSGIMAKIDAYNPAVVFVDGVYMMIDEQTGEQNTPLALTHITRSLKRLAQRKNIPIVCSTQVLSWKINKKKGLTADTIGYTSSFAQDSDVIFGLESTEHEDEKRLKIVAARNLKNKLVLLRWDWESGVFEESDEGFDDEEDDTADA